MLIGVLAIRRYRNIRIEAVHYCDLEETLSAKRQRRTKNGASVDVPGTRLQLLSRTLRENPYLAGYVQILRLPFMTREGHIADLARTVSVLPRLRYIDLPEAFYKGEPSCHTLRQEAQARCPEIRKMTYCAGSEAYFDLLSRRHWNQLEVLELTGLRAEANSLRRILPCLPQLRQLKLSAMPWLGDNFFHATATLPSFPSVQKIILEEMPQISVAGLKTYLSRKDARNSLTCLSLQSTGIAIQHLHILLAAATSLEELSFVESVQHTLTLDPLPPLASPSLKILYYEVTSSSTFRDLGDPAEAYYSYLSSSLISKSLPKLRELYVRDPAFPESLLLAPPSPVFAGSASRAKPNFSQTFEVYSKGLDDMDWVATSIGAPQVIANRTGFSGGRPLSSYSASRGLGPQWGVGARHSIVVGNEHGSFLTVPVDDPSLPPQTLGPEGIKLASPDDKRSSRYDLWR